MGIAKGEACEHCGEFYGNHTNSCPNRPIAEDEIKRVLACKRVDDLSPEECSGSVVMTCKKCEKQVWAMPKNLDHGLILLCVQCAAKEVNRRVGKEDIIIQRAEVLGTNQEGVGDNWDNLANEFEMQTSVHSFPWSMEKCETFGRLLSYGWAIVPLILRRFQSGQWGMNWIHLLQKITGENILVSSPIKGDGDKEISHFVGVSVDATAYAWIEWGKKKGLIS